MPETGLFQNYFRDYDPQTGRYIESDPIGLAGESYSMYSYAGDNPVSNIDMFGLESASWSEIAGQIAAVGLWNALQARSDAVDAVMLAVNSGLSGLHNGPADTYRHCVWSCLMTKSIGPDMAAKVGATHEHYNVRDDQEPMAEFLMDTQNNAVGRCAGVDKKKPCRVSCMEKFKNGELNGLGGLHIRPTS